MILVYLISLYVFMTDNYTSLWSKFINQYLKKTIIRLGNVAKANAKYVYLTNKWY